MITSLSRSRAGFGLGALLGAAALSASAVADVRLPSILSDGVVLQRESRVQIFGFAAPEETVRVRASWGATSDDALTDQDGRWSTTIVTPSAGGPFTLEVRGKNVVTVANVLVGEVWLCTGQSNMEMPVAAREGGYAGVLDWQREVAAANDPSLRYFTVENTIAAAPRDDVQGEWNAVTPESVGSCSATAYFFGRKLRQDLGIPVGLVASDWGGTPAESWTSGVTLKTFPEFAREVERLEREARAPALAAAEHARAIESWLGAIEEVDHGVRDGFAAAGFDDSGWAIANVPGAFGGELAQHDGIVWMRRSFNLPLALLNRALALELGPIDDFDATFVDGVRVGGTSDLGGHLKPRAYTLPAALATPGRHVIAVRVFDNGGAGGILGTEQAARLRFGEDAITLAGAWRVRAGSKLASLPRRPTTVDLNQRTPSALYNGMIAPLVRFSFRGVIWYQGESNRSRAAQYKALFPALITDWRARLASPDMPFYYVQIAPYAYAGDGGETGELREAQRLALELPHTGMVVTSDIGDERDIHPKNKAEVGRRLAQWALARTYGRDVECSGPTLRAATFSGDPKAGPVVARLEFDHADGLWLDPQAKTRIEVEVAEGRFEPAGATVEGHVVTLTHPGGRCTGVRFGQGATDGAALFNAAGLPASPFRTSSPGSGERRWITDRVRAQSGWKRSGDTLTLAAPITSPDEAIPLGNGLLGARIFGAEHDLYVALDRGDLWDLRPHAVTRRPDWNWRTLQDLVRARAEGTIVELFDAPYEETPYPTKLPLPRFHLSFPDASARSFALDLAQAECRVTLTHGSVRAFASSVVGVVMMRIDGVELTEQWAAEEMFACPDLTELGLHVTSSSRTRVREAVIQLEGPGGMSYAIAAVGRLAAGGTEVAIAIVSGSESSDPKELARERAVNALEIGYGPLLGQHTAVFRGVAGGASVSIPDAALQTQYDLVRYLTVSGSRRGAPPMPLQGVWTRDGGLPPWKGDYHNDLNTQATYGAYATAGLFDSGLAYLDFNWALLPRLREFARDFYRVDGAVLPGTMALDGSALGGWCQYALSPTNGAWTADIFARHWRVSGDETFLSARAYPWCSAIGEALLALAPPAVNGKRKLPLSSSPEIHGNSLRAWLTPNSNYDLALLRSSFTNLSSMASALNRTEEARKWARARDELDEFDLDERGALTIAPGEPYAESHRHFSHALAIHPLGLLSIEGSGRERAIVDATLDEILEQGPSGWRGYSYAWFACLAARAGRPETALGCLRDFERGFTLRNGLHCNGDQSGEALSSSTERVFTLEGNMLAMAAVHEMLLQSWGGVVRVFPAVSVAWPDAAFDGLWAEGAFAVSARRAAGVTVDVTIHALRSGPLRLRDPFPGASPTWNRTDAVRDGRDWIVTLAAGDELIGTRLAPR